MMPNSVVWRRIFDWASQMVKILAGMPSYLMPNRISVGFSFTWVALLVPSAQHGLGMESSLDIQRDVS